MNDQDERVLTRKVAQELIQELFAGQTVQIQQIKKRVDEIHAERDGQPFNSGLNHPVTYALLGMKNLGLADNPERGFWSIFTEDQSQSEEQSQPEGQPRSEEQSQSERRSQSEGRSEIETLDQFMVWARQFEVGKYVFRGVPKAEYRVQASAYRRPEDGKRDFEKFLQINKDLIRDARLRGYDRKDGPKLRELEILADLQHFGAATCLIDFSYNAQVALWFACQPDDKNPEDSSSGKVFAVRNQPPKFTEITPTLLKEDIDYFLKDGEESQLYHWQPRQQNHRIIAQQSIFLFGHYQFGPDEKCVIAEGSKEKILCELQQVSGITEDRLFPDFEGFAHVRGEDAPYTELTPSGYKDRGLLAYERREYKDAISDFDLAIDRKSDYAEAYYWRGLAKYRLKRPDEEIIADYSEAIRLNSNYAEAYYERGRAKYRLKQHEEAVDDLSRAVDLKSDYTEAYYWRGLAKYYLEQYEEVIVDCSEAIRLDPTHARFYQGCGRAKYRLQLYEEAIVDHSEAIRLDPDYREAYYWRGLSKKQMGQDASAILDFDIAIRLRSTSAYSYYHRAGAKFNLQRFAEAKADLKTALSLARQDNNDTIMRYILNLLHEIESRTVGGS